VLELRSRLPKVLEEVILLLRGLARGVRGVVGVRVLLISFILSKRLAI
jgi:hypothetical protein